MQNRAANQAFHFIAGAVFTFMLCRSAVAAPFSDIPTNHWAAEAVETLAAKGFVTGFSRDEFGGNRPATRYETAVVLVRMVDFIQTYKPYISPSELEKLKEILADYQDEIQELGLSIDNLEKEVAALEPRVRDLEKVRASGEFHSRTVATQISGLSNGIGQDTTFTDEDLNRPYALFPVNAGESETQIGYLTVTSKLDDRWEGGGRIAAYNSVGDPLNGLVFGGTPSYFSNPFEGYAVGNNLKTTLDQIFAKTQNDTLHAEIGSFYLQHSPSYFFSGIPNLTEEGPDFLPNYGGRFEADLKPYLVISKAYSEIYAGKLGQASSWQTDLYGANLGIELLGVAINTHWMSVLNDPATFPSGTSGMVSNPINGGNGWLNPTTLTPLALGPQKEHVMGVDLSVTRTVRDHPIVFKLAFASSDYKPNTNSSDNAGGELYDISVEGGLTKNFTVGAKYLSIDPKYSPFILPFALPTGITLANFPWGQWPFPVDYSGYYTLQNAQEYPQNRQGEKLYATYTLTHGKITADYRWLSQKVPTELTLFNNSADIQSIGFFEPFFTATGGLQTFPLGKTSDWNVTGHYDLSEPLGVEMGASGVWAERVTGDVNNVNFNGWLGHAGIIYSFYEKWKLNVAYHLAQVNGRLLAAPNAPPNYQFQNRGESVRIGYDIAPKADIFLLFHNLNHLQTQGSTPFHLMQFITGLDYSF